jgi:hypothetical protein
MKRFRRWLLVGLIGTLTALWPTSHFYEGSILIGWSHHGQLQVGFCEDLFFFQYFKPWPFGAEFNAEFHRIPQIAPYRVDALGLTPTHLGFGFSSIVPGLNSTGIVSSDRCVTLIVPFWFLIFLVAILNIYFWRLPRVDYLHPKCPTCGYDLRATPDRCPECGSIPPKKETIPT